MHPGGVSYTPRHCDMILSPSLSQQHSECRRPGPLSMVKAPPAQAQLPGSEVLRVRGQSGLDSLHLLLACKLTEGQHRLPSDHKGQ